MDKKINILIVEDEVLNAMTLRKTMENFGYNVIAIAKNYEECIEIVFNEKINIILMDINLGENSKTGIEAATDILKHQKNILIIYLTGNFDDETIMAASKTNPAGYIIKPYTNKQVKVAIDIAIDKKNKIEKVKNNCSNILLNLEKLSAHIETVYKVSGDLEATELANFIDLINEQIKNKINYMK